MVRTMVGALLGLVLGAAVGGSLGAALGALFGALFATLWVSVRNLVVPITDEMVPERVEERVVCIPKGEVAECVFVRDRRTGRWLDVERCSACADPDQVGCAKRCLILMAEEPSAPTASAVPA